MLQLEANYSLKVGGGVSSLEGSRACGMDSETDDSCGILCIESIGWSQASEGGGTPVGSASG